MTVVAGGCRQRVKPPNGAAGYSGAPLAKKLGITSGCKVLCIDAPAGYRSLLEPIPHGVMFTSRARRLRIRKSSRSSRTPVLLLGRRLC